jgi:hypothetical protein
VKGKSGNPAGKPKNALNKQTIILRNIRDLFIKDAPRFHKVLKEEAFEKRESWAMKLFSDIIKVPRAAQAVIDINENADIDEIQKTLLNAISQIKEFSHDDILNCLKVLAVTKANLTVEKAENGEIKALSDEQLKAMHAIMHQDNEKGKTND